MSDGYVPISELADYLSVKVTTVRSWVNKGYIPKTCYIKLGNTYRFSISDTVAALTSKPESPEVSEARKKMSKIPVYKDTREDKPDGVQSSTALYDITRAPEPENPQLSFDFDEDDDL